MKRYFHQAYLLAEFRYIGTSRAPVLYRFCVRSESHNSITTDYRRGFYATVTHADGEDYEDAVKALRKSVQTLMPSVAELVRW